MKQWIRAPITFYYDMLTGPIDSVVDTLEGIKAEYGPDIRIEIELDQHDYDGGHYVNAYLQRLETDEEYDARLIKTKEEQSRMREHRRKMYETLKKEFE